MQISLVFRLLDALGVGVEAMDAAAFDYEDKAPVLDAVLDEYYNR